MNYHRLGKSELKVSKVSFGCMSLKGNKNENINLIHKAIDEGINYFDTADLYDAGENEKVVGEALKERRKDVVLATKVGNQMRADGSGWDWNPRKSYILMAVEESLRRLQTDYIDLYQLHGGTIEDPIDETIEAFELLKSQGKIREYGISSIRPNVIRRYADQSEMVAVMMQYSLLDRRPEEECLDLLSERGISVLVRGAYAKGLLLNKPPKSYLNWSDEEVGNTMKILNRIGMDLDSVRSLALAFVLDHPAVASIVSGIRTIEQLNQTLRSLEATGRWKKAVEEIKVLLPKNIYQDHR